MARILIVEDNLKIQRLLVRALDGNITDTAASGREALAKIRSDIFQAVLLDVVLPDVNDLDLLKKIKQIQPQCQVIVMTGHGSVSLAVNAIKSGAYDFLEKPFNPVGIKKLLSQAIGESCGDDDRLPGKVISLAEDIGFAGCKSREIKELLLTAYKIAGKDLSVLIYGETGTGKELLARFIHAASKRSGGPFFPVNCGAFTESLAESELFGHEKGAFTGADRLRRGCFELADRGTIFLDEIGEASLNLQAKFLRVLETGEFQRVGSEGFVGADVRVLAATNIDLVEAVKKKVFREDLYYRLAAVCLQTPPLRRRRDDIPALAYHFLQRASEPGKIPALSEEVIRIFMEYSWPGNVRELSNAVKHAVALADGGTVLPGHLPAHLRNGENADTVYAAGCEKESALPPPSMVEYEKAAIITAMKYCQGCIPKAASVLGIGQATLYRKINRLNIVYV